MDDLLFMEAKRLLIAEGSLVEIEDYLGYADQASFSRAFRRWSGTSPAKWRA